MTRQLGTGGVPAYPTEWETPPRPGPGVQPGALDLAVRRNRDLARRLGWGNVITGRVRPIEELRTLLRLPSNPSEQDLAQAVLAWQQGQLGPRAANGQLGPTSWNRMWGQILDTLRRGGTVIPSFRAQSWPVRLGGRQLGVIDKTAPYQRCFYSNGDCATRPRPGDWGGGARLHLGFRVTDMAAVQAAGFVDAAGEDRFRWIQVLEFITVPVGRIGRPTTPQEQAAGFVRQASRSVDPTSLIDAPQNLDRHPYYWDEVTPATADPSFRRYHVGNWLNRTGSNRLAYDLLFEDRPRAPYSFARPGRRSYWNFEVALVGVREGRAGGRARRNVILNTVRWGYDLVIEPSGPTVRLNALTAGPFGGSPALRRVLNRAIAAGEFRDDCFVGPGFTGAARC
jgi:hypothetical protein